MATFGFGKGRTRNPVAREHGRDQFHGHDNLFRTRVGRSTRIPSPAAFFIGNDSPIIDPTVRDCGNIREISKLLRRRAPSEFPDIFTRLP